jgi:sulfoxide reductase heme-binding subunit YedZ
VSRNTNSKEQLLYTVVAIGVGILACAAGALIALFFLATPLHSVLTRAATDLFALGTVQTLWYVTRAAGLMAYLLLWFSTAWGLAVSSKIFDPWLNRFFTFDFHQFLSLLSIGFIILHVGVLLADHYLPFTLVNVLVPFTAPYRPVWVGVGIISFYLTILVSATFYMKSRISRQRFRTIHYLSYLAFAGAAVHGLFAGTDSPLLSTQIMYAVTTLSVVFLTAYRILTALPTAKEGTAPGK